MSMHRYAPAPAAVGTIGVVYNKRALLAMGADEFPHAVRLDVPLALVTGRDPPPSMEEGYPGRAVVQPIEVEWDEDAGVFYLFAGNHRVTQAEADGASRIPAFVHDPRKAYAALTGRFA